jgi:hypothetical protein
MGLFDSDLYERIENAEEAIGLNNLAKRIVKEENNKLIDESVYNYNLGLSALNNQVVGEEYK